MIFWCSPCFQSHSFDGTTSLKVKEFASVVIFVQYQYESGWPILKWNVRTSFFTINGNCANYPRQSAMICCQLHPDRIDFCSLKNENNHQSFPSSALVTGLKCKFLVEFSCAASVLQNVSYYFFFFFFFFCQYIFYKDGQIANRS